VHEEHFESVKDVNAGGANLLDSSNGIHQSDRITGRSFSTVGICQSRVSEHIKQNETESTTESVWDAVQNIRTRSCRGSFPLKAQTRDFRLMLWREDLHIRQIIECHPLNVVDRAVLSNLTSVIGFMRDRSRHCAILGVALPVHTVLTHRRERQDSCTLHWSCPMPVQVE
jgi:hypothetical protein